MCLIVQIVTGILLAMNVRLLTLLSPGAGKAPPVVVIRDKFMDLPNREKRRGPQHVFKAFITPNCTELKCEIISTHGSLEQASWDAKPLSKAIDTIVSTMAEESSSYAITTVDMV